MLRSNSRQATVSNEDAAALKVLENVDIFEKTAQSEKLTFQDQYRFTIIMVVELRNREHDYFQYKAGALDEEVWHSYREKIAAIIGSEHGRKWWNAVGKQTLASEFVEMVDDLLAEAPISDLTTEFGRWE